MAKMLGVREHAEGYDVELIHESQTGRLVIQAKNEGGNNETLIDLWDLIEWLRTGPPVGRTEGGFYLPLDRCREAGG
jgi:hypothetical protein